MNTAKRLFSERVEDVEIIHLHGSIELEPVTDLSDVIFDVVQTGYMLGDKVLRYAKVVVGE